MDDTAAFSLDCGSEQGEKIPGSLPKRGIEGGGSGVGTYVACYMLQKVNISFKVS